MSNLCGPWPRLGAIFFCLGLQAQLSLCFGAPPAPAKAAATKGKKALPPKQKNAVLSAALNDKGPQIQQCAIEHALEKGAKKVDIDVRVTINKQGGVVDTQITANVSGGDNDKVKSCVEEAIKTAKFPPVSTPLATAERTWTIAAQ